MQADLNLLTSFLKSYKKPDWENTEAEIRWIEIKWNVRLPKVLKDYYRHFGKCPYITQGCNNHYEPLKYALCTAVTSDSREALLQLIDKKELLWSCSNTGLQATDDQINQWLRRTQEQSPSTIWEEV